MKLISEYVKEFVYVEKNTCSSAILYIGVCIQDYPYTYSL